MNIDMNTSIGELLNAMIGEVVNAAVARALIKPVVDLQEKLNGMDMRIGAAEIVLDAVNTQKTSAQLESLSNRLDEIEGVIGDFDRKVEREVEHQIDNMSLDEPIRIYLRDNDYMDEGRVEELMDEHVKEKLGDRVMDEVADAMKGAREEFEEVAKLLDARAEALSAATRSKFITELIELLQEMRGPKVETVQEVK